MLTPARGTAGTLGVPAALIALPPETTRKRALMDLDWQFNGLPLHVLFIHFVLIVVPLAALLTVLVAAWPAARRRIGIVAPVVALAAVISIPITVEAGEWLEERVAQTPLLEEHADMGETLLPWVVGLFLIALAQWAWFRFVPDPGGQLLGTGATEATAILSPAARRVVSALIAIIAVTLSIGSTVSVVLIGESGVRSVWLNSFQ